jgi:hypothetical protein
LESYEIVGTAEPSGAVTLIEVEDEATPNGRGRPSLPVDVIEDVVADAELTDDDDIELEMLDDEIVLDPSSIVGPVDRAEDVETTPEASVADDELDVNCSDDDPAPEMEMPEVDSPIKADVVLEADVLKFELIPGSLDDTTSVVLTPLALVIEVDDDC